MTDHAYGLTGTERAAEIAAMRLLALKPISRAWCDRCHDYPDSDGVCFCHDVHHNPEETR